MSAIVQAICPGCRHVLRIPADWLGQAFRCKHCGMIIQARAKAPEAPPPAPAAEPVGKPVAPPAAVAAAPTRPAKPAAASSAADPLSFEGAESPAVSPRSRRRRRSGGLLAGLVVLAIALGVAVGGSVLAWPYLSSALAPKQVAENNEPDGKEPESSPHKPAPLPDEHGKWGDLPRASGAFPRRALAISINDYLFANPINYGMPIAAGANVQALLETRFTQPSGLHIAASQVGILSDAARPAVPPTEPVIRNTVLKFLGESRPQDRVILLIVGHVVEIDGEPVLLPIDGSPDSKDGTIPLKWVYDQLSACKARQKVLVLDTCRLDPGKGLERPGSGPMGAKLDAMLKEPPPGVQVWTACVAEQFSYEFEVEGGDINNGVFLQALWNASYDISKGKIQSPSDPLPLERLVEAANADMKAVLGPLGKVQTSRLAGSPADGGAEPDAKAPPPSKPQPAGLATRPGGNADLTQVRTILQDISFAPLKVAKDRKPLTAESLPPFPAATLKEYMKDGEATPLRAEVMKARNLLAGIAANNLTDYYIAKDEKPLKEEVRRDQKTVAKLIGELTEESDALKEVAEHRKTETKRWQATYDYVTARMDAQVAYLNEYEAVLGQILKGLAPPDPNLYRGWRLASQYDPQSGDRDAKKLAGESRKKLEKIIAAYPGTPWEIMAKRDRASGLGLEWQPLKK